MDHIANDPNRLNILLVEDNPGDVGLFLSALEEARHEPNVEVACDGIEALRVLRQQGDSKDSPQPDLVVLDLNLPRMDGRQVLKQMKSDPLLKTIPVIIMSSSSDRKDVLDCYDLGANCYVVKPSNLESYERAVLIEAFWGSIAISPSRRRQPEP